MHRFVGMFCILLAAALFAAVSAPAPAQRTEIEKLAADLASKLPTTQRSESDGTRIVVFPFIRSQGQVTDLGALLAQQFAKSIGEQKKDLDVAGPEQIQAVLSEEKLAEDVLLDLRVWTWLAKKIGATVFFSGLLEHKQDGFHLTVRAVRALDGKEMAVSQVMIPTTPEYEKLFATDSPSIPLGIPKEVPSSSKAKPPFKPGRDGTTYPECSYCPNARFPDEARKIKFEGAVLLDIMVSPEGRASDISIVRGLPFDLNKSALEIIQTWRFKPSMDRSGNAVPVHVLIEVFFRLPE